MAGSSASGSLLDDCDRQRDLPTYGPSLVIDGVCRHSGSPVGSPGRGPAQTFRHQDRLRDAHRVAKLNLRRRRRITIRPSGRQHCDRIIVATVTKPATTFATILAVTPGSYSTVIRVSMEGQTSWVATVYCALDEHLSLERCETALRSWRCIRARSQRRRRRMHPHVLRRGLCRFGGLPLLVSSVSLLHAATGDDDAVAS